MVTYEGLLIEKYLNIIGKLDMWIWTQQKNKASKNHRGFMLSQLTGIIPGEKPKLGFYSNFLVMQTLSIEIYASL